MSLLPRVRPVCGRCGKPREALIGHVCRSNSNRKATVKVRADWGQCPRCHKPTALLGLGHVCKSKRGDYGRRKSMWAKSQRSTSRRPSKPQHLYQSCSDPDCGRTACVAWKEARRIGREEGYELGYEAGLKAGDRS